MNAERSKPNYPWLILPPIAIGIAILAWMVLSRQPPVQTDLGETARPVRVVEAQAVELAPIAEGYGPVRPVAGLEGGRPGGGAYR